MYIYICIYMFMYMYIYSHTEREGERETCLSMVCAKYSLFDYMNPLGFSHVGFLSSVQPSGSFFPNLAATDPSTASEPLEPSGALEPKEREPKQPNNGLHGFRKVVQEGGSSCRVDRVRSINTPLGL